MLRAAVPTTAPAVAQKQLRLPSVAPFSLGQTPQKQSQTLLVAASKSFGRAWAKAPQSVRGGRTREWGRERAGTRDVGERERFWHKNNRHKRGWYWYCGSAERVAGIEVMPSKTDKQIKTDKTIKHSLMSSRRLLLINIWKGCNEGNSLLIILSF